MLDRIFRKGSVSLHPQGSLSVRNLLAAITFKGIWYTFPIVLLMIVFLTFELNTGVNWLGTSDKKFVENLEYLL